MKRAELRARVEHWRVILAPEWRLTVIVDATHLDDDQQALSCSDDDYCHGEIAFDRSVRRLSAAEVDVTIVHELLHCLTREYRRTLDLLQEHVAPDLLNVLHARHVSEEERFVDRLSRVIAYDPE